MKRILILFIVIFNLKAIEFALIDSFNDAPNFPSVSIKTSDMDNDGFAEIIFVSDSFPCRKIAIYEKKLTGGFGLVHGVPKIPDTARVFHDFEIGDFDNDGKPDALQSFYNLSNMIEYFQIIEAKFSNSYPDTIVWNDSLFVDSNNPNFYAWIGDLDDDGKPEIVIYKGDATDLLIYENEGDNNYNLKWHKNWYSDTNLTNGGFTVGDLDMDGHPEFIIGDAAHLYNWKIKFFEVMGDDSIALVNTLPINNVISFADYDLVFVEDINNNGKVELMVHGVKPIPPYWRDDIWITEATGDNQYEIVWYDSIPNNPSYPDYGARSSAGDVTGDGIPEIILSMTSRVYILSYIPGQGYTYIWQKYYAYNTGNISTAVYDINGNGINDVILAVQHQEEHRVTYIYEMVPSVSEKYKKISPYFYAFPDITSDSIKIFYSLKTKKPADFYIYNILGEKLYFKKIKPEGKLYLSLKELKLKPGIYFLRINSENFKKIDKVIFLRR